VEAVPLQAGAAELPRQGNELRDRRLAAVEARVEAGHLRYAGQPVEDRLDGRHVVRLVERRQGDEGAQLFEDLSRDDCRTGELRSAMDDAVADAEDTGPAEPRAQPGGQSVERAPPVAYRPAQRVVGELLARAVLGGEPWRRPDALDLSPRFRRQAASAGRARRRTSGSTSRRSDQGVSSIRRSSPPRPAPARRRAGLLQHEVSTSASPTP
jgi:hypothetical protein